MAKLIYSAICSLDGYISDESGNFEWAAPDDEAHAFINELERPIGTYLYGRRMYDVMSGWETMGSDDDQSDVARDFSEIWRAADKVVFSRSLESVSTTKTRIERNFDPEVIREMKRASDRDISIGGPDLAAQAITARMVDEYWFILVPIIVDGGNLALPADVRVKLELVDERRFANGMVYLHYRTGA